MLPGCLYTLSQSTQMGPAAGPAAGPFHNLDRQSYLIQPAKVGQGLIWNGPVGQPAVQIHDEI